MSFAPVWFSVRGHLKSTAKQPSCVCQMNDTVYGCGPTNLIFQCDDSEKILIGKCMETIHLQSSWENALKCLEILYI